MPDPTKTWCVERLLLANFRGFEKLELHLDPETTVLIGINGAGKTAVLDGIAVMLSTVVRELRAGEGRGFALGDVRQQPHRLDSREAVAHMEPSYPVWGGMTAVLDGERYEWSRVRKNKMGKTSWAQNAASAGVADLAVRAGKAQGPLPVLPVIAAYSVERLVGQRRGSGEIGSSRFGAYAAALESKSDMRRLTVFLRDLTVAVGAAKAFDDEPPHAAAMQLQAIDRACTSALRSTGWAAPRWTTAGVTLTHERHGTLLLEQLSAGIGITAGLVIDLASRAARANPWLGSDQLLERVPGIVLIDEVDLHLHPSWQQRILGELRRVFPQVQFIVTTHSPQVLSAVPAEQIRIIDGDAVRRVDHARGLRSDIVLETVMGTEAEAPTEERERLDSYMAKVYAGQGRSDAAVAERRTVEREMGGIGTVPELADADAYMALDDEA
ncbi:MAG: AAA family ATPase [Patulibacter sp.]|nr:AAA family ATPase [Patulibacter sp.]